MASPHPVDRSRRPATSADRPALVPILAGGRRRLAVRSRIAAGAALLALGGLLLGWPRTPAPAYYPESARWPGNTTVGILLQMGNQPVNLSDGSTSWNQVVGQALLAWNPYLGSNVRLQAKADDGVPARSGDSKNSVTFGATFFGQSLGKDTLALTGYLYDGSTMAEADTVFNTAFTWDSYRGPLQASGVIDLRRVAVHEFGHVLGLDHPDDHGQHVTAVMNAYVSDVESPQNDDVTGVQNIYGSSGVPPPAVPTPTPAPTATPTPAPAPVANPAWPTVTVSVLGKRNAVYGRHGVTVVLTRAGGTTSTNAPLRLTAHLRGTARVGADFSLDRRQWTIPAGQTSLTLQVVPLRNPANHAPVELVVRLYDGAGYNVGNPDRVRMQVTTD